MNTFLEQADEFRRFVGEQISNGSVQNQDGLTIAELFERWQLTNLSDEELQESLAAFDRGVADAEAGRTIDAAEAIEQARRRIQELL